jgi:hypothetical protein
MKKYMKSGVTVCYRCSMCVSNNIKCPKKVRNGFKPFRTDYI